jgi:hypothetical protein
LHSMLHFKYLIMNDVAVVALCSVYIHCVMVVRNPRGDAAM